MKTINKIVLSSVAVATLATSAFATCGGDIDMGSHKIYTNATDFNGSSLVTKAYVDSLSPTGGNPTGWVMDHEGHKHPTVTIGSQTWMADNMYVDTYPGCAHCAHSEGDLISRTWDTNANGTSYPAAPNFWITLSGFGRILNVEDNSSSFRRVTFGNLYQYRAAIDSNGTDDVTDDNFEGNQGICPAGWHVPTNADWDALEVTLGDGNSWIGDLTWANGRAENIGTQLKVGGSSGFNAMMTGYRYPSGAYWELRGVDTYFWASVSDSDSNAWKRELNRGEAGMRRYTSNKSFGYSVRCIKN